jgi:phospho-N-acetylmuramoyl-pentapeptide-transferase
MIFHLLYPLHTTHIAFNVLRYISFRAIAATLTALLISFVVGPWLIRRLRGIQMSQMVREDVPSRHQSKNGTPTMGGSLIILGVLGSTLLWGNLTNVYIWLVFFTTLGFSLVGFVDDYRKVVRGRGISARAKVICQGSIAVAAGLVLYSLPDFVPQLTFPFFKNFRPDLGVLYFFLIVLVLVGASNAVNLTDGLDGLAIGPVLITAGTFALFTYLTGRFDFANYLQIPYVRGSGELCIMCGAMVGAAMGFLWFNSYPAQVFMGDIGSLSLGGALGMVALISKQELLLALVGGVFVVEALSVIIQVGFYKWKKRRIFLMAPIHHHFELKGWAEPKIIVRFWIISMILALMAISTLKLR